MVRPTLMVLVAGLIAVAGARADDLTLDEALALARAGHPELAAADSDVAAAAAWADQAGAWPNPAVFLKTEAMPEGGDLWYDANRIVGVRQALPWGGRVGAAREAAAAGAAQSELRREITSRSVEARVRMAFAGALAARETVELREAAVAVARRVLDLTEARVASGDAPVLDLRRARMAHGEALVARDLAAAGYEVALAELAAAAGVAREQVDGVVGELGGDLDVPSLATLMADLPAAPRSQLAAAAVREQEALVQVASRERRPDLELEVGARWMPDGRAMDAGVAFALPLLDRGGARLSAARAAEAAAGHRARGVDRELEAAVRRAHAELTAAAAGATTYGELVVPEAIAALQATETAYRAGEVTITDVFAITRDWLGARQRDLDLRLEVERARTTLNGLI